MASKNPGTIVPVTSAATELEQMVGAMPSALLRNNKQIRADRAISIVEDAETIFKRTIEDLTAEIKKIKRDRESMLDLSPTETTSLKLASEFDAKDFVERYITLGLKIRDKEITLKVAQDGYNYLFGSSSNSN